MSKILLIKPRFLDSEFSGITHPMGLLYIGATLKKAGHEPRIHDCVVDYKDLRILKSIMIDWKPDFIGISIIITELEQTKIIMRMISEILPDIPVTFGGPWPSTNPEKALQEFGADYVVIGEGDLVYPELINAKIKKLPTELIMGTASMVDGKIKINLGGYLTEKELAALPFPAWELLDHKVYAKYNSQAVVGNRPYMTIVTSRGCPFKCAYCHQTMGKEFRKRSAESVLSEIEELLFRYKFKEYEIVDDCFNLDRQRMHDILTGIRDRIKGIRLHFPNGLRADILEMEDIALLKQAGTVSVCFAVETASPRIQKYIHKYLDIEKTSKIIHAVVKEKIYTMGFFMIGFPTETYQEASDTVTYALRSPLHRAVFFNPKPFKGTELESIALGLGIKDNSSEINYYSSALNISAMSDGEIKKIFRRAYSRFYLNPRRLLKIIIYHPQTRSLVKDSVLLLTKIIPRRFKKKI